MTSADKPAFLNALVSLQQVLNGPELSPIAIDGWWRALQPYPLAQVLPALERTRDECRFWPRPAEVIARIRQQRERIEVHLRAVLDAEPLEQHAYWQARYEADSLEEYRRGVDRWRAFQSRKLALQSQLAGAGHTLLPERTS